MHVQLFLWGAAACATAWLGAKLILRRMRGPQTPPSREALTGQVSWLGSKAGQTMAEEYADEEEYSDEAEYMYSYHGVKPEQWDEATLEECCLETLPRKISAEEPYYRAIAPVLSSYFTFLAETGRLRQGARLARAVTAMDRKIVQHAADPRYWGMAKSFTMGALKAGVDPTNEKEMQAYMLRYNQRLLNLPGPEPLLPLLPRPVLPARVTKIGRNEPCPCGSGKKYKKCCGR